MTRAVPWLLVGLQFFLLIALAVTALVPHDRLWALGLPASVVGAVLVIGGAIVAVLGVVGLGPSLTASPVPKADNLLTTTGVYGLVRHPIYTGLLTGGLGLVALGASVLMIVFWIALLVLLAFKSRWEERMLSASHESYAEYGAHTGRFVPGVGRLR